jgi:hypothetical protein
MSKGGGAGSLYSTVKDLYLWNEGLFAGRVLKEDSRKAFLTPVRTGSQPADENGYGYGVGDKVHNIVKVEKYHNIVQLP